MNDINSRIKGILEAMPGKHQKALMEELHAKIKSILDDESIHPRDKNNYVSGMARQLIASGEDSGLENDQPRQGSSRAVYFPSEHRKIKLDGHDVQMPTAVKVAFPGYLDKYNKSGRLLGEHQNAVESDPEVTKHGVIVKNKDGSFRTNPNGILVPHVDAHHWDHWVEVGRVTPLADLAPEAMMEYTKSESHPEGIAHYQFYDVLDRGWDEAHGKTIHWEPWEEKIKHHPLVKAAESMIADTGMHPADFTEDNVGVWTHPVTGKKQIVIHDYGYDNEVAKHYYAAKQARGAAQSY